MLKKETFDDSVDIELTATSSRTTKEAKLAALVKLDQLLIPYYEKIFQLGMISQNPQTPPGLKKLAVRIAEATGELVERNIREFDTIRDPRAFVITLGEQIDQAVVAPNRQDLAGLGNLLGSLDQLNAQQDNGNSQALLPTA